MKIILAAVAVLFAASIANAIYLGTVEGYTKDSGGSPVSNVTVNATVIGCSGAACSQVGTSDANGYYVIANLNLPAGGTVRVTASKGSQYGESNGTADQFQAAYVNVTMCTAPPAPTLQPIADTHNPTTFTFNWTSSGPRDDFYLNGNTYLNVIAPQYQYLSYGSHTWGVRSCNATCCSGWVYDSFSVYNNPPSQPVLTDQPDTIANNVTLSWTSGTDPDSDPTYDEYQFQSNPVQSNVTSPQNESGLSYQTYTWKVRTCDDRGACSAWASDSFSVVNNPCPPPVLQPVPDGHFTSVILNWTSNATDIDGDPCHDRYQFGADAIIDPATSPQTKSGLSLGVSYTWRVQSCDNKGACSPWQSDTFITQNNAPSAPVLIDQNHTDASSVGLRWTSGTDPDSDTTYDEYQFDSGAVVSPATSPQVELLSGIDYHTWRVRTCDSHGACSSWSQDTFVRYECPACPPGRGGGGGACVTTLPPNATVLTCMEDWVCEEWSACNPLTLVQTRECADIADCGTKCYMPDVIRRCSYSPSCWNGIRDVDETDVDCGGVCMPCEIGKECKRDIDCALGICYEGVCTPSTCYNGVQDDGETGVDCGGPCPPCFEIPAPVPPPAYYIIFAIAMAAAALWLALLAVPHLRKKSKR
ncbi:MAG: hypothetical protein QXF55_00020 [Candidatus Aenigmatarchaeota archaeon]